MDALVLNSLRDMRHTRYILANPYVQDQDVTALNTLLVKAQYKDNVAAAGPEPALAME